MGQPKRADYHESYDVAPRAMVCRICRELLAYFDPRDGRAPSWEHRFQPDHNHRPDPASQDEVEPIFVCDFCMSAKVRWSIPAMTFHQAGPGVFDPPGQESDWGSTDDWAACTECKDLVVAEDLRGLADRAMVIWDKRARYVPALRPKLGEMRSEITALHAKLLQHRMGPPEKYEP